jgi:glucose-6-phosphate 1-dehydrogenase
LSPSLVRFQYAFDSRLPGGYRKAPKHIPKLQAPMSNDSHTQRMVGEPARGAATPAEPCVFVVFGASGDLTRRLLMPSLYNLACDGLLSPSFAVAGVALDPLSTEQFRERMTEGVRKFNTRPTFDDRRWADFAGRLHYTSGDFADPETYRRLATLVARLDADHAAGGNVLFYLATPPAVFGLIAERLGEAGLARPEKGWARLIVEKPFGRDLTSAAELNRRLLAHWAENQIYRIDHYLGKETVQNLLAFRFSNGIFESVWNKDHVDHIQFAVAETVGVEGRGKYYDRAGAVRDMMQNHMFQMLAYLCMEPPASLRPDAVRNEKAKLLDAVRVWRPDEAARNAVRGQYGPGRKPDGSPAAGYRQEPNVDPQSATDTFAALRLFIDNWRWEGVPIYLRTGKSLWKRGTEIVVQFKKAPNVVFRDTPAAAAVESNRLVFHVQPDQGIEFRFHAKAPGPAMRLQQVNMRFDYREAFEAPRGTGYEVLLYSAMTGDATLFSRTDLVETAWRIAKPVLDAWAAAPPTDFPNYPAGSWGPKAAYDLIGRDGRRWVEVVNRATLERVPLFRTAGPVFLHNLALMLKPVVYGAGEYVIRKGEAGDAMYVICRGQVNVLDESGAAMNSLGEGDFFGEISLLLDQPRTASIRAATPCDLFILDKADFQRALQAEPQFAASLRDVARSRYPGLPEGH